MVISHLLRHCIFSIWSSFFQDKFLSDPKNEIDVRIDPKFDTNDDFIEKIAVVNKKRFALALNSGNLMIIHINKCVLSCINRKKIL